MQTHRSPQPRPRRKSCPELSSVRHRLVTALCMTVALTSSRSSERLRHPFPFTQFFVAAATSQFEG